MSVNPWAILAELEAKQDKTAVVLPMLDWPPPGTEPSLLQQKIEADRLKRTFPIPNKYHFLNKNNKQIREEILRVVKEGDVKGSPVDMDEIEDAGILYPDWEDVLFRDLRLKKFKEKFYRNNPNWESEEELWKQRKQEGGFK